MDINKHLAKSLGAEIISAGQLVKFLREQNKGATFASIVLETEPKMNKKGNPYYGRVKKINRLTGLLNFNYDEGVRRRLIKEGKDPDTFIGGSSWHKPVIEGNKLTPLLTHADDPFAFYLRFAQQSADTAQYLLDGVEIDKLLIEPYLPDRKPYQNQNLSEPLRFIAPSIGNIREINIAGRKLIVSGD